MAARTKMVVLGCKAKDVISGFTGIVTSHHRYYSGAEQYGIQPPIDKKNPHKHPDPISFDVPQLEWIGPGYTRIAKPESKYFGFALGDEVRDKVTGYTGIAERVSVWMNGCVNVGIRGKAKPDEKPDLKGHLCELVVVERVGPGLNAAPKEQQKPRTGGASQRVDRA